jgi:hypothetical protein
MILLSLCLTLLLLVVVTGPEACPPEGPRLRRVAFWCAALGGPPVLLGAVAFPLAAAFVLLAAWLCRWSGARRCRFVPAAYVATAAGYAVVVAWMCLELKALAARNGYESMEDRLAYEGTAAGRLRAARPPDENTVELLVHRLEDDIKNDYEARARSEAIARLHRGTVAAFLQAQGFGEGRLKYVVTPEFIESPDPEPLSQRRPAAPSADGTGEDDGPRRAGPAAAWPDLDEWARPLWDLHHASVLDFVNARGFGHVKDRAHVAGFRSHQFRKPPKPAGVARWEVARVELVSLLKHDQPAVYLSENLPRMSELRQARARPLDDFEADALPGLIRGGEIVSGSSLETVRVLGAIRAGQQCLDCHAVERGDLLGAFSYRLRRVTPGEH